METNSKELLEDQVSQALVSGTMKSEDPEKAARERLRPRYEIRITAETDPIVEETRKVRSMAEEVDDRYEAYLKRAEQADTPTGDPLA